MTLDEIDEIVQSFISSARLVKGAGFDGVEIHSAHGYFLNQFYSPLTNLRDDAYGGSLEKELKSIWRLLGVSVRPLEMNFLFY